MKDRNTTLRKQITEALEEGDTFEGLTIILQKRNPKSEPWASSWSKDTFLPPEVVSAEDPVLDLEYDSGYGDAEAWPCIAYSERFVYIHEEYDGSEWFGSVPRSPEVQMSLRSIRD